MSIGILKTKICSLYGHGLCVLVIVFIFACRKIGNDWWLDFYLFDQITTDLTAQKLQLSLNLRNKGAFNNYVDRILPFFDLPPFLDGQFLYPERGQKQTFFDPLPPSYCPRRYWMVPKRKNMSYMPIRVKHKNCPKMSDFKICTCLTFDPAPSPYFPL